MALTGREAGLVTEIALAAADRATFRAQLLEALPSLVPFDLAFIQHTPDAGRTTQVCTVGYDGRLLDARIFDYLAEFHPHEIAAGRGRIAIDTEQLPARRRDRLSIYHELLRPQAVRTSVFTLWSNPCGDFGFHLARTGARARFRRAEVEGLSALIPAVQVAEAWMSTRARPEISLTARERQVAALVVRGLQNREIAAVLQTSPLTVRNQLVNIYRKAQVSNRTELVYVMGGAAIADE